MTFPPELQWNEYRREMRKHSEAEPEGWRHPWRWSTVVATMFVGPGRLVAGEVEAMREAGLPLPPWDDEDVTNLLHQRYHLWQWERRNLKTPLSDLGSILEIGPGYGAMALVAHRLGFRGAYHMVDFPEMLDVALAHVRLRAPGLRVSAGGIDRPDLLIANFSLSEMPLQERNDLLGKIAPRHYLIGMQPAWAGAQNVPWFASWAQGYFDQGGPPFMVISTMTENVIYLISAGFGR